MAANCKLNNLEYLALQMLIRPGQSGRFYLGKLHQYRFPIQHRDNPRSNFCARYFAPCGQYFGKLWKDEAKCTVEFMSFSARGKRPSAGGMTYKRPVKSAWYLTADGLAKALDAAAKIGLPESEVDRLLETPCPRPKGTFKQQLLDWWKSQPECKARRVDLVRQYGIISGRLHPDGTTLKVNPWPGVGMSYVSLNVAQIIRQHGFKDNLKVQDPNSRRKLLVYNLNFDRRG